MFPLAARVVVLVVVCLIVAVILSACGGGGSSTLNASDADLAPSTPLSVIQTSPAFQQPTSTAHNIKIPSPITPSQAQ